MAENTQTDTRRLLGPVPDTKEIIGLPADDATNDHRHQCDNHQDDVLSRPLTDGHINEALAEPHHQQAERHPPDTSSNTEQHIHADALRIAQEPNDVLLHSFTFSLSHFSLLTL